MNHLSTSRYLSEPLIINQEDSVSAIDATCQPGTGLCEAGQIADHIEQSEPGWDGAAAAKHGLRKRPLTRAQLAFVEGVVRGETHKAAYRAAYPGDSSTDASCCTCMIGCCRWSGKQQSGRTRRFCAEQGDRDKLNANENHCH